MVLLGRTIFLYATLILVPLPQLSGMDFNPCKTKGCLGPPIIGDSRCIHHVSCSTQREGLWSPEDCKNCRVLIPQFRKDPVGPTAIRPLWLIIRPYIKLDAKKAPVIGSPDLQALLDLPSGFVGPAEPGAPITKARPRKDSRTTPPGPIPSTSASVEPPVLVQGEPAITRPSTSAIGTTPSLATT